MYGECCWSSWKNHTIIATINGMRQFDWYLVREKRHNWCYNWWKNIVVIYIWKEVECTICAITQILWWMITKFMKKEAQLVLSLIWWDSNKWYLVRERMHNECYNEWNDVVIINSWKEEVDEKKKRNLYYNW